ncbi:MAG TPA: lipid-transfer protein [Candidatus Kryptonia bacterium]|nr:lipid-transfer protein [Candidatus Kryptonia bacterium]
MTSIRDQAAIVGIGQTDFSKQIGKTEHRVACEAIAAAIADAGLKPKDIDGIVRYDIETNTELAIIYSLGIPHLRFFAGVTSGGGAVCGTIVLAAMAVTTGQANNVVCFRARNRGKRSVSGAGKFGGGRPWEKTPQLLTDSYQYHIPFGLVTPAQEMAIIYHRHMHEYGTTTEHFGMVAVAQRAHAARNPNAVMREPITLADHQRSRWIAEPLRLLDCCLETDGACAVVVTAAERARDTRQRPAYILAGAQAEGPIHIQMADYFQHWREETAGRAVAKQLYAMAGVAPADIDAAMFYDHFSPAVLTSLEDYGFCARGESGPFVAAGNIAWPDGSLPVNTHGGSLSEAFIHGYNHVLEGVRQIRGTSTSQVADAELVLVTSSNTDPTGAIILRR